MPAKNPRLTITLTPAVFALLRSIGADAGKSQASVAAELLEGAQPVLERMATVLSAATKMRGLAESTRGELVESMARAQDRVETQLGLALEDLDFGARPILREAEKIARRSPRSSARVASPAAVSGVETPVSLTGGSGPSKGRKSARAAAAKSGGHRA